MIDQRNCSQVVQRVEATEGWDMEEGYERVAAEELLYYVRRQKS